MTEEAKSDCCLKLTVQNEAIFLCANTTYRCEHEVNKLAKAVMAKCNAWYKGKER